MMEPLPIHGSPLLPIGSSRSHGDQVGSRQNADRKKQPAKDDADDDNKDNAENAGNTPDGAQRSSDGIVGTVIDVEA